METKQMNRIELKLEKTLQFLKYLMFIVSATLVFSIVTAACQ